MGNEEKKDNAILSDFGEAMKSQYMAIAMIAKPTFNEGPEELLRTSVVGFGAVLTATQATISFSATLELIPEDVSEKLIAQLQDVEDAWGEAVAKTTGMVRPETEKGDS